MIIKTFNLKVIKIYYYLSILYIILNVTIILQSILFADKINTSPLGTTPETISDETFQDVDTSTLKNWSSQDDGAKFMSTGNQDNDDFVKSTIEMNKASSHAVPSRITMQQEHHSSVTFDKQKTEAMEIENSSQQYKATAYTTTDSLFNSAKESVVLSTETTSVIQNRIGQIDVADTNVLVSLVSDTSTQASVRINVTSLTQQSVPYMDTTIMNYMTTMEDNIYLTSPSSFVDEIEQITTQSIVTENKINVVTLPDIHHFIDNSPSMNPHMYQVSSTQGSTDKTDPSYVDNSPSMNPHMYEVSSTDKTDPSYVDNSPSMNPHMYEVSSTDKTDPSYVETTEHSVVTEQWFKELTPKQRRKYSDTTQFKTTQDTQDLSTVKNYTENNASISESNKEVDLTSTLTYFTTNDESINHDDIAEEVTMSITKFDDDSKAHTKSWSNPDVVTYPTVKGTC
jgi:hypothetical protein